MMLENAILLVGICDSKYRVGEIIPLGTDGSVRDSFGEDSCFYKAAKIISRFNQAAETYLLSLNSWLDLVNMGQLIAEMEVDYIVPLNLYIDEKYLDERYAKTVTYTQMLLRALGQTVSTVIMTGKEAQAFETLDDFLSDEENRLNRVSPELINVNRENLIYVANNLSGIEYANAALAAIISSTDYSLYPSNKNLPEAVFDIDFSDIKTNMAFFKNNHLTGTTIENLVNFSDNPLYKPFTVKRILKYFYYHRPDADMYRGRPYSDYIKTKIVEAFDTFLGELDGWIIYKHEILSAIDVSVEPGAVEIIVKYAVWPKFTLERYVLEG